MPAKIANKRNIDITEYNVDLDALLETYDMIQREAGIDTKLIENDIDIDHNGHVTKVRLERTPPDKNKDECSACQKKCDNPSSIEVTNKLGKFGDLMSPEIANGDDDDDTYICEYCSEIGCTKEFSPHLCETCTACESCTEFDTGECSGCTYSSYRTGRPYSVELKDKGLDMPMSEDDAELLDILTIEDEVNERIPIDNKFTVMDYDHKY